MPHDEHPLLRPDLRGEERCGREFGTPREIMTDEVLTRVFDTPVHVIDGPSGPLAVYY